MHASPRFSYVLGLLVALLAPALATAQHPPPPARPASPFRPPVKITGSVQCDIGRLEIGCHGYVFQNAALFDSLTIGQNVAFPLRQHRKVDRQEMHEIVTTRLAEVGLPDSIIAKKPAELSGGMRKRVGLARAIAYGPDIILYDEPSTGIDPIRADAINDLINMMKRDMNVSTIVITHDIVSAYKVADRIAMLYEGKIVEAAAPEEIRNSKNPVIQQFIHGRAKGPIKNW